MNTLLEKQIFDPLKFEIKNINPHLSNVKYLIKLSPQISFKEDQLWLEKVLQCMQKNLSNNYYTIQALSIDVAISERQLRRKFKKLLGCSPSKYFRSLRLNKAHQLLQQKEFKTITQVAYAVGYKDVGTFSENYLKRFGESATSCLFR